MHAVGPWAEANTLAVIEIPPGFPDAPIELVSSGRNSVARVHDRLYALRRASAQLLTDRVPLDLDVLALDGRGRVFGRRKNRVVLRWSKGSDWTEISVEN